jgi:hypothetical protein
MMLLHSVVVVVLVVVVHGIDTGDVDMDGCFGWWFVCVTAFV